VSLKLHARDLIPTKTIKLHHQMVFVEDKIVRLKSVSKALQNLHVDPCFGFMTDSAVRLLQSIGSIELPSSAPLDMMMGQYADHIMEYVEYRTGLCVPKKTSSSSLVSAVGKDLCEHILSFVCDATFRRLIYVCRVFHQYVLKCSWRKVKLGHIFPVTPRLIEGLIMQKSSNISKMENLSLNCEGARFVQELTICEGMFQKLEVVVQNLELLMSRCDSLKAVEMGLYPENPDLLESIETVFLRHKDNLKHLILYIRHSFFENFNSSFLKLFASLKLDSVNLAFRTPLEDMGQVNWLLDTLPSTIQKLRLYLGNQHMQDFPFSKLARVNLEVLTLSSMQIGETHLEEFLGLLSSCTQVSLQKIMLPSLTSSLITFDCKSIKFRKLKTLSLNSCPPSCLQLLYLTSSVESLFINGQGIGVSFQEEGILQGSCLPIVSNICLQEKDAAFEDSFAHKFVQAFPSVKIVQWTCKARNEMISWSPSSEIVRSLIMQEGSSHSIRQGDMFRPVLLRYE
jgi:hypothetical protein